MCEQQQHYIDQVMHIELEKLNRVEAEAWDGWQRSCQDAVETMSEGKQFDGERFKDGAKFTRKVKGQAGDASFLRVIESVSAERRKLLGADAPERHVAVGELDDLPDEVLDAVIAADRAEKGDEDGEDGNEGESST